jgi:hypothetical protein
MIAKIALSVLLISSYIIASENNVADCIILEDEGSIVCKYSTEKLDTEQLITVKWINPSGELDREREITILPNNTSVYDFRYIDGRNLGVWKFAVLKNNQIVTQTTFKLE